jgi:hypothetical protein
MVYGTSYCGISHLPIHDGDECIVIPLGFRMGGEFDKWNAPDQNSFAYLHTFIVEPIEVIYGGNSSVLNHNTDGAHHKKGDQWDDYELFMLVHKEFYTNILNNMDMQSFKHIENLPLFNTVYPLWEEAKKIADTNNSVLTIKFYTKQITIEEYNEQSKRTETPEWILKLYKIAWFMGKMGIAPHPNWTQDQHDTGELYEEIRKKCLTNKIKKS